MYVLKQNPRNDHMFRRLWWNTLLCIISVVIRLGNSLLAKEGATCECFIPVCVMSLFQTSGLTSVHDKSH